MNSPIPPTEAKRAKRTGTMWPDQLIGEQHHGIPRRRGYRVCSRPFAAAASRRAGCRHPLPRGAEAASAPSMQAVARPRRPRSCGQRTRRSPVISRTRSAGRSAESSSTKITSQLTMSSATSSRSTSGPIGRASLSSLATPGSLVGSIRSLPRHRQRDPASDEVSSIQPITRTPTSTFARFYCYQLTTRCHRPRL